MKDELLLEKLEETAERLSIKVDYDDLHKGDIRTNGGIFTLKGEQRILIHKKLSTKDRVGVLLHLLSLLDTEGIHLPDAVRKRLETSKGS
ncbi:MAG: hypothetical protein ACE5EZ_03905 [Thermodesulfobacteriota bacterium]